MPFHEFRCEVCKENWDELMTVAEIDQNKTPNCPDCGGKQGVHKVYTAPKPHSSWGPTTKPGQK